MKKKLLIISLFIILLFPFNIKADSYTYTTRSISRNTLVSNYGLTWPSGSFYVNSGTRGKQSDASQFWFHAVNGEVSVCGGIDKHTVPGSSVTLYNGISSFRNNLGEVLNENQQRLLMDLLTHGYHHDGTLATIDSSRESLFSMIAMQILAWEIIEEGRTTFYNQGAADPYAPNVYNASDSAYNKIIYPNGGSNSLYSYYVKILKECYEETIEKPATFNGKTYNLTWTQSAKRYENTVDVGPYVNCSSENSNYKVSVSGSKARITTTSSSTKKVKITCSYIKGNGSQSQTDEFKYYEFPSGGRCANNGCQKIIVGKAVKKYEAYFYVKAEEVHLRIVKKNKNNEDLSGATFTITKNDDSTEKITLTGNGDAKSIKKSGRYVVRETVIPAGFEALSSFYIDIDANRQVVASCAGGKASNGKIVSCLNGKVQVNDSSTGLIVLTIVNESKNFTIKKVDENNNEVKGATFRIKDSNNNDLKFSYDSGIILKYDTNGTIIDITNSNLSQIKISLLPAGEYTIVETAVPYPYVLPSKESERSYKIKLDKNYNLYQYNDSEKGYKLVSSGILTIKNFKSKASVVKTGDGKPLEGVKFKLYKEDKTTFVNSRYISPGKYEYDSSILEITEYVTNSNGRIEFNNLPVGTYYLLETETIDPYILPEGDEAYTKLVIDITKKGLSVNGSYVISEIGISNSKFSFSFYKIDEEGNYLKNGRFKIQKYDNEKDIYRDIKVKRVENDGTYSENADIFEPSDDGEILFTLKNGIGTFINMKPSSKYRIVEREAPKGYVRVSAADSPTVTIDEYGYSSGLLTLINQKVASKSGDARAELIINISTGQQVIKYGLIIGGVIISIVVLIAFARKIDKDQDKKKRD